jgi:hypothetical protein
MYFFRVIRVICFFLRFILKQRKFNDPFIASFIAPFYELYNTELSPSALKKIRAYYCFGVPLVCEVYTRVYGRRMLEEERENAVLGGIATPLIDDFTDNKQISQEQLNDLLSFSERTDPGTLEEAIVNKILCRLHGSVSSPEGFVFAFNQVIKAQVESEKQLGNDLSGEELLKITWNKGAWSHILFHYLIREVPSQQAMDVMYQMGGVLQVTQDIFDIHKDVREGISTLATNYSDFREFEKFYRAECIKFCTMARQLPYNKSDLEFFIILFANIMARGIVALKMLSKLQEATGGGILPYEKLERKQLICDMDKPASFLKMIWFAYELVRE